MDSKTMLPAPLLPQEIYYTIIDQLRDDKPSLKSCSLVASSWRTVSQMLLHETMILRTTVLLPDARHGERNRRTLVWGSEKARPVIDTSSRILPYVRSIVICGHRPVMSQKSRGNFEPKLRMPNTSLLILLKHITTNLVLPSLTSVELRDLTWSDIPLHLQRAVVLLLNGRFIKDVSLVNCGIPSNVRWLRFVGPEVKSLRLDEVKIIANFNADRDASFDDMPMSSAPNLSRLDIAGFCNSSSREVTNWILVGSRTLPSLVKTVSPDRSWRKSVTTLSLHCRTGTEGLSELFQRCSHLTTLKLNAQGYPNAIPLDEIMYLPTLVHLHFLPLPAGQIPWLMPSFKTIKSPRFTTSRQSVHESKTIHLDMWVEPHFETAKLPRITLSSLLIQIQALDKVAASNFNMGIDLTLTVLAPERKDNSRRIEYETTKASLVDLRDGTI